MTIELDYDCTVSEEDLLDPYKTREMSYEVQEAANFFSFHGYIFWVEKAIVSGQKEHGVFPRELVGNMSFLSKMFYDKNKLPARGKYILVDKDKLQMVVICSLEDKDKFAYHTQTTISLFVSYLGLTNKHNEKVYAVIHRDIVWVKDLAISKLSVKNIKGNCIIINTFSPITKTQMENNGFKYFDQEQLDIIGSDDLEHDLKDY